MTSFKNINTYPFDCISDFIFVKSDIKPSDIILVPGSDDLNLIRKAGELYLNDFSSIILPSGGYNPKVKEFTSEWDFLVSEGIKMGIPKEHIYKEDKARNTFENAKFSLDVIRKKKLDIKTAIIVCKGYHSRRALLTYQRIFPSDIIFYVVPIMDKLEIQRDNWYYEENKIQTVMNEVVKIGEYFKSEINIFHKKFNNKL